MKKLMKQIFKILFAVFITISVGLVLFIAWFLFSMGRTIEPDFVGYQPTVALNGAVVTNTEINTGSTSFGGKVYSPNYLQAYDSGVVLSQSKSKSSSPASCQKPITHNAEQVLQYKCQTGDIEGGNGTYAVTAIYKKDELISVYVSARIGGTYMFLNIPESQEEELAKYTGWQAYFESMRPVNLSDR